jgi:hypothetical protein
MENIATEGLQMAGTLSVAHPVFLVPREEKGRGGSVLLSENRMRAESIVV